MAATRLRQALYGVPSVVRWQPGTFGGDPSNLEDFLERHEVRAIVMELWNIYTWLEADQGRALPGPGFVRGYIERDTVSLTHE